VVDDDVDIIVDVETFNICVVVEFIDNVVVVIGCWLVVVVVFPKFS
jgi:hypothetical protein